MKILIETSARHAHVTKETLEILFGSGAELHNKKDLSQPGQFACEERITVVGPKKEIVGVSILGPCRKADQVELSATDARSAGITPTIRESGDTAGSPGCVLRGPAGEVAIKEGVIVAKRHVHVTPEFARENGLTNGQSVGVKITGTGRSAVLEDTIIRVHENFAEAMHIDTDESNAVSASGNIYGEIIA